MFPRLAHFLLRLALIVSASIGSACSVYDPSLLGADEASASAAATSIGGATNESGGSGGRNEGSAGSAQLGSAGSASTGGSSTGGRPSTGGAASTGGSGGGIEIGKGGAGSSGGMSTTGGTSSTGGTNPSGGASSNGGSANGGSANGGSANGGSGGAGAPGLDPCLRSNWKASASESSVSTTTPTLNTPAPQAIDGNTTTRWSSGAPQVGGEWFLIDLGAVAPHLTQIALDTSGHPTDYPSSYKLEASNDGASYAFLASGSGSSVTTIKFSDKSARYLKITQTGSSAAWWSIHELSISCQSN